jgi:2-keto-4-pentenoate hydratase
MQAMCGVNQPIAGAILAQRVHDSPATIRAGAFVHLGLETELSFRIAAAPKPGAEVTAANVREVVDLVAASFELIEDRAADYSRLDAGSMIADNSWNGGIVLAEPVRVSEIPDFKGIRGVLTVNGVPVDSGLSEDVGGDPLEIVAWLIRCLSDRGRRPEPGQWIMTGSVVPTKFPVLGDVCSLTFDGFPPVEMTVV